MSDDELGARETRIAAGCDHLATCATAWFTAGEYEGRARVNTVTGRALGAVASGWFAGGLLYVTGPWAWAEAGAVLALSVWVAGGEHTPA